MRKSILALLVAAPFALVALSCTTLAPTLLRPQMTIKDAAEDAYEHIELGMSPYQVSKVVAKRLVGSTQDPGEEASWIEGDGMVIQHFFPADATEEVVLTVHYRANTNGKEFRAIWVSLDEFVGEKRTSRWIKSKTPRQ